MDRSSDENARFHELVRSMRKKQIKYFTGGRDALVLRESKELEERVEKGLAWIRKNQAAVDWNLTAAVRKMLDAQQLYYANRNAGRLSKAKQAEREVDRILDDYFDTQINLFDQ